MVKGQAPGWYRMKVGAPEVTAILAAPPVAPLNIKRDDESCTRLWIGGVPVTGAAQAAWIDARPAGNMVNNPSFLLMMISAERS